MGHTPTAADEDKTSPAPAQDATKGPGSPQSPGNPGPGYTPARLTGLILGPALFVAAMLFFNPAGLSPEGQAVLAVTLWVATWWITEAIPIPVTSLLPVVLMPLTGALEGDAVVSAYGNDIIFLFIGGFTLAIAMEKWNLHQRIALSIVSAIGTSPKRIVLGFMVATAFLSMWVSNTAATMMMIPVGLAVVYQAAHTLRGGEHAAELPKFEKSIVFGIGYAATIGGLGTLIGTPPLAILAATTGELFGETISFGQWMMFGVPIVILLLAFTWFFLTNVSFKVRFKHLPGGAELIRSEKKALGAMSHEEKAVLAVFLGVAFLWVTRSFIWEDVLPGISDGIIAIIATVVLFTLPTRRADERRIMQWEDSKKIPWGILLLFGGGLAIAAGFVETGLSGWIGEQLRALDGVDVILIILLATALVLFMTEITSNAATATMILPVMAAFAIALGIHPFALMVPCAMAANCAFMLPVGTPPNAILFGTGKVTIMEMVKTGFWLNIAALLLIVAAVLYVLPSLWGIDLMSTPAAFQ
ncbi:SLC13 family permease [Kocuria rosea]|uniref:SLC13 family permease n=1 Tax=Kocuria rosea TaxID=1275 RepID=UPI001B871020|nr:SLC13 family permease [Kocuria rosea]